jgi:hypothetical protein
LRCLLHSALYLQPNSGDAGGQACRCPLPSPGPARPLPAVWPTGAPAGVRSAASVTGNVRQLGRRSDALPGLPGAYHQARPVEHDRPGSHRAAGCL